MTIDIEGIKSAILEDHTDPLNIAGLADYLEESGDDRGAEFVRKYLSTRIPEESNYAEPLGDTFAWYRNSGMQCRFFIPKWLYELLPKPDTDYTTQYGWACYSTEEKAMSALFDALLKGDE